MSELHYALLAAAAAILIGLFVWSKWQERNQIRRLREQLRPPARDALLDPPSRAHENVPVERIEPHLGPLPASEPGEPSNEPTLQPAAGEASVHPRPQLPQWTEDPLLDCVLEIRCAHAVDGVAVIDAAGSLGRLNLGLATHLVAWDGRSQQWVVPDRFGFYTELLAAIQLANRQRRLSEIEASKFIAAVQQIAMALDADFDAPDVGRVVQLADELARQIRQFDVQIGLTLESGDGGFHPGHVARAAQQVGLQPAGENRWRRLDATDGELYSLRMTPAQRLVLELDVARVPATEQPLRSLFACATELAALLNARVVDDHARPVGPGSVDAIAVQLDQLYQEMKVAGLEAGSTRAQRLYAEPKAP